VHRVIYEELCAGVISDESRRTYQAVIARLTAQGATAVILGCTEISLLIKPHDSPIPTFDTTLLHALYGVDFALQQVEISAEQA
jgi:aspartate racemase